MSDSLNAMKIENELTIPAMSPQNAPALVVRFQNMPSIIVANSGALTQLKIAWM